MQEQVGQLLIGSHGNRGIMGVLRLDQALCFMSSGKMDCQGEIPGASLVLEIKRSILERKSNRVQQILFVAPENVCDGACFFWSARKKHTFFGFVGIFFRGMYADWQSLVTEEMCKNQPKREASHLSVIIRNFCSDLCFRLLLSSL